MLRSKLTVPATGLAFERPRLLEVVLDRPIAVLAAPAGHGKTSLAAQAAAAAPGPTAWFTADELDRDAASVVAQLFVALGRAWPELADAASEMPDDAAAMALLGATLETLAGPGCVVLDDVHLLPRAVVEPLVRTAATSLPSDCHLVVCTRLAPPEALVRAEADGRARSLDAGELAYTADECVRLAGSTAAGERLRATTGGWPLAVALSLQVSDPSSAPPAHHTPALVDIALAGLPDATRELTVVLARLPRFPAPLLARLGQAYGSWEPWARRNPALFERSADGWWSMREWLRDLIASTPAQRPMVDDVLGALRDLDQGELATRLLVTEARYEDAVPHVERLATEGLERGRAAWVRSLIEDIPRPARSLELRILGVDAANHLNLTEEEVEDVAERRLLALVQDALPAGSVAELRARSLLADHYRMTADPRTLSACEAALGDALTVERPDEELPGRWSAAAVPAVARMLRVYGNALMLADDRSAIERGRRLVAAALSLLETAGRPTTSPRAWFAYMEVLLHLRRPAEAVPLVRAAAYQLARLDHSDAALRLAELATMQFYAGDHGEVRPSIEMAREYAARTGNHVVLPPLAAIETGLDVLANGVSPDALAHFDLALAQLGEQERLAPFTSLFAAEFGIAVLRVGAVEDARRYLARARAALGTGLFAHTSSFTARRLEGLLHIAEGDAETGAALLAALRDDALSEGRDALAFTIATDLTQRAEPADTSVASVPPTVVVQLLAPEVGATVAGEAVPPPRGFPAKLLALLAASGGVLTVDHAIEGLWPGADPDVGRNRLHGVLLRLRRGLGLPANGPITCTEGLVRLARSPLVTIDSWEFERLADRSREEPAARAAALASYSGDLLSRQFAYEDLVADYRRSLRRTFLTLATGALTAPPAGAGLDELVALARRVWTMAPDDEAVGHAVVGVLRESGLTSEAREVIEGTARALAELGLNGEAFRRQATAGVR